MSSIREQLAAAITSSTDAVKATDKMLNSLEDVVKEVLDRCIKVADAEWVGSKRNIHERAVGARIANTIRDIKDEMKTCQKISLTK